MRCRDGGIGRRTRLKIVRSDPWEFDSPSRHIYTDMKKLPILIILGPTATGKSDLAVRLAQTIAREKIGGYDGAEIISADSRQVYRSMNIGTGKVTEKEMGGIPHHLLDVADPKTRFSVVEYQKLANRAIEEIAARSMLPIICGGTGFYIDAVLGTTAFPAVSEDKVLRSKLGKRTVPQLYRMLSKLDPRRATSMNESDSQNPVRLIRAIEIACSKLDATGNDGRVTDSQPAEKTSPPVTALPITHHYEPITIGLEVPLPTLRERINDRLLKRLDAGMLDECRKLHEPRKAGGEGLSWKRMEELGLEYRYQALYLQGQISMDEMVDKLRIAIGQYVKRQITWFKRNKDIHWFRPEQYDEIVKFAQHRFPPGGTHIKK